MGITRRQAAAATGAGLAAGVLATGGAKATGSPGIIDVVVVGAGVFGAWTAWSLRRKGMKVALLDAYAPGNARSSSGGESRVIRLSYGGDLLYSQMARDSLAAWAALSGRQSLPLMHRTGVLWFSPAGDDYMSRSLAWLQAQGVPHEAGDTAWLRRRYPQVVFRDGEGGFLETQSGALIAGRGVQTVVADAGLTAQRVQAAPPVRLSDGTVQVGGVRARSAIYACGPWLPRLFPDQLKGRIVATRQEVYHFGPAAGDGRFSPPALPVWADFNAGDIVYGIPGIEGQGFKIAFDRHGVEVDPDRQDRRVSNEGVDAARAYLAQRFPGL
ncbi:MAG: FAD-dependent oxidoreductase, partial [Phenylobacterium sp.]